MKNKILITFIMIFFASGLLAFNCEQAGIVSKVVDGDTIWLDTGGGTIKVRFVCIDTPERGQSGYKEAKDYVKSRLLNRVICLDIDQKDTTDKYGRTLAVIIIDGVNFNNELLTMGLARVWKYFKPSKSEFNPYNW